MIKYAKEKGMEILSILFSGKAVDQLEKMGVRAYKADSDEMNNLPLVEHIAEFGEPMIISAEMSSISTITNYSN